MSAPLKVHLRAIYYLPSWQGGDVVTARCRMSREGYVFAEGLSLSDDIDRVDCEVCLLKLKTYKPHVDQPERILKGPPDTRPKRRVRRSRPPPEPPSTVVSLFKGPMQKCETIAAIATDAARRHYISMEELRGPSKLGHIVRARQEAFALCYATGRHSLTKIGIFFGYRDHTTVLHGIRAHKARTEVSAEAA